VNRQKVSEEFENIKNLTKFYKERNLPVSSIRDIYNGRIKRGNYKGWYIKNNQKNKLKL